jgi:hypothetical protein
MISFGIACHALSSRGAHRHFRYDLKGCGPSGGVPMKNRWVEARSIALADIAPWLLIALAFTLYYQYFASFVSHGEHPDELSHTAYIEQIVAGRFLPDYAPRAGGGYLNHPALYYMALGLIARLLNAFGVGVSTTLAALNYLLGSSASLLLYAFARVLTPSFLGALTAGLCAVTVPFFSYLYTGVNNDNLGILLVFGAAYCCACFYEERDPKWFAFALSISLLALLTKLTSFVQAAAVMLPTAAMLLHRPERAKIEAIGRVPAVWITAGLVVAYFGYVIAIYGEPFPHAENFLEIAKRQTPHAFATEAMPFQEYVRYFLYRMRVHSSGIYSHVAYSYTTSPWSFWTIAYAACLAVVSAAALRKSTRWAAVSILLSLAIFTAAYLEEAYLTHLHSFYLGGLQIRYYLPLLMLLVTAAVAFATRVRMPDRLLVSACLATLLLFTWHDARNFAQPAFIASRAAQGH